ncbi:MAG: hypothetical protein K6F47_00190 [Bacteroidaceae bacterium]|nr:hypothetical protein [Bacteroidaceae bacterium]
MIIFVTMNNIYYRDIIELLLPHGKEGVKLSLIVRYIYNQHVDMFNNSIKYEELYKLVGSFMWKQSQKRESPFTHNSYGVYAIKPDVAVQLDLFWDLPTEAPKEENKDSQTEKNNIVQMELFKSTKK